MSTQVEICNMALSNIGVTEQISAIDQADSVEAEMCNLNYDNALDEALQVADWGFARRRMELVTQAGTPPPPWDYQYQYPSNCVRARSIDDGLTSYIRGGGENRIPFTTETDQTSGARVIFTSWVDAILIYTYREADSAKYPAHFVAYLAWVLAAKIVRPIINDAKEIQTAEKSMMIQEQRSIADEYGSEQEYAESEASWIRART